MTPEDDGQPVKSQMHQMEIYPKPGMAA
jgi:hypothetical protein